MEPLLDPTSPINEDDLFVWATCICRLDTKCDRVLKRRFIQLLIASAVSVLSIFLLMRAVDWRHAVEIFHQGVSVRWLALFPIAAICIVVLCGLRWRMLVGSNLNNGAAFIAAILGLGGNMLLPARGGDLVRAHYTQEKATIPYSSIISRLLVEKVIDLSTVFALGIIGIFVVGSPYSIHDSGVLVWAIVIGGGSTAFLVMLLVRFQSAIVSMLQPLFRLMRTPHFFEKYVVPALSDAKESLSLSFMTVPALITLAMWLFVYSPAYMIVANFTGVALTYQEALLVLFAGTLGLMVPAAPSGIGTYHASVVSVFILMGRPASEGLLLATAVHFLFFLVYSIPALLMFGCISAARMLPRNIE